MKNHTFLVSIRESLRVLTLVRTIREGEREKAVREERERGTGEGERRIDSVCVVHHNPSPSISFFLIFLTTQNIQLNIFNPT